jgi:hypothetical protein
VLATALNFIPYVGPGVGMVIVALAYAPRHHQRAEPLARVDRGADAGVKRVRAKGLGCAPLISR